MNAAEFSAIEPGTIFATGEIENSPEGVYMTNTNRGAMLRWVALKGGGDDWCIYLHWAHHSIEYISQQGDKLMSKEYIQKLVPCDDETYNKYRR